VGVVQYLSVMYMKLAGGEGGGECLVSGWCVRSALSMNFRSFLLPKLVE